VAGNRTRHPWHRSLTREILASNRDEGGEVDREIVNPWTWQDQFGFVQANVAENGSRVAYCAGQTSVDENGSPVHEGDMGAQIRQACGNLQTVLEQSGMSLADVVRLNYYVTDLDAYFGAAGVLAEILSGAGCRPASTLLKVSSLALPQLLIEIEATAVA
jgi:enamine deaminase RidA (YjgF/YER057c/UK114 family)